MTEMVLQAKAIVIAVATLVVLSGATYVYFQSPGKAPGGSPTGPAPQPPGNQTQNTTGPMPELDLREAKDAQELINASNLFALEMYRNISEDGKNLFFSPYSIFTALGMCYEGAAGRTGDEIQALLHFPKDNATRWSMIAGLIDKMNAQNPDYSLKTANALYIIRQSKPILEKYLEVLGKHYKAGVFNLTGQDAEKSRLEINAWVENRTNGMIKDLLPPGVFEVDAMNLLALINTIYFKGTWLKQFDPANTTQQAFFVDGKKTVQAPLMKRTDDGAVFNYTAAEGVQALRLDYNGQGMSMLLLIPQDSNISRLEGLLGAGRLDGWRRNLTERRVDVYIPRFKLECQYGLSEPLKKMGMPTAFSENADFSWINGGGLSIARVIHKAVVDVNEEGTEAAAATAVIMGDLSIEPPVPIFKADHPFIFLIQDNNTGNILFMGKVADPTK